MEETSTIAETLRNVLFFGGLVAAALIRAHHQKNPPDKTALTQTMAGRSWKTVQVATLIAALFLLYFAAGCTGQFFYEEQLPAAKLAITLIIYAILIGIIAVINRIRGENWKLNLGMGFRNISKLLLAPAIYLAIIPFMMLISKGWHLLLEQLFASEVGLQDVAEMVSGHLSWLEICYILVAIFVAPVYEELIFRGIIFPYFVKRAGLKAAMVLVSGIFAVMHFHLPSFVPLALLSSALCLAYWRTGSLWVSIGIHMLFNAVSILALNIST